MDAHDKARIALRYYLMGAQYWKASEAMHFGEQWHSGRRKDGVTPEFAHQIWIANFLLTLKIPEASRELCVTAALLHDTAEDYDVAFEEIGQRFGPDVQDAVDRLTKKHRGVTVAADTYFLRLAQSPVAALVKGVDRTHNIHSMTGVFTPEKQQRYIEETRQRHLPMLKAARRAFPAWSGAFENVKQTLEARVDLIERLLTGAGA